MTNNENNNDYFYSIINTQNLELLSTEDGKQVFPSIRECEETLIVNNDQINSNTVSEAKWLELVKVQDVDMPLFQIYREDTSYGNQHLIYVDQKRASTPEEAVRRSLLVKEDDDVVVVKDDDHELVEVNKE